MGNRAIIVRQDTAGKIDYIELGKLYHITFCPTSDHATEFTNAEASTLSDLLNKHNISHRYGVIAIIPEC